MDCPSEPLEIPCAAEKVIRWCVDGGHMHCDDGLRLDHGPDSFRKFVRAEVPARQKRYIGFDSFESGPDQPAGPTFGVSDVQHSESADFDQQPQVLGARSVIEMEYP